MLERPASCKAWAGDLPSGSLHFFLFVRCILARGSCENQRRWRCGGWRSRLFCREHCKDSGRSVLSHHLPSPGPLPLPLPPSRRGMPLSIRASTAWALLFFPQEMPSSYMPLLANEPSARSSRNPISSEQQGPEQPAHQESQGPGA